MAKASKPKTVAEVRDIPMKDKFGKTPGWWGKRNHLIQPTSIVTREPRTAPYTINIVSMAWAPTSPSVEYILDPRAFRLTAVIRRFQCAVKGTGPQREINPPGNWIAPPGSNRSGGGGNKAAGASGVEGRIRRLGESAGCNASER